jgi:hypothetical protein
MKEGRIKQHQNKISKGVNNVTLIKSFVTICWSYALTFLINIAVLTSQ